MNHFLSCDWGTSSFRLRLVQTPACLIIAEIGSGDGIAATFALWQQTGDDDPQKRASFYLEVIKQHIDQLETQVEILMEGLPVIISGMASSTIGFMELPYAPLPIAMDKPDVNTAFISATDTFRHDVLLISGLKTDTDVVRGEETQLIGCISSAGMTIKDELFIFPGTHSKHIRVQDNLITEIKTYMTGEFFELLSQKSILRTSVESADAIETEELWNSFKKGVHDAIDANLLNLAFKVRTNTLFNRLSKKENFTYLSGLVIGAELKDLRHTYTGAVTLLCGIKLSDHYVLALEELGIVDNIQTLRCRWVDDVVVRGQYKIYKQTIQ